jgi:hypothetical protein
MYMENEMITSKVSVFPDGGTHVLLKVGEPDDSLAASGHYSFQIDEDVVEFSIMGVEWIPTLEHAVTWLVLGTYHSAPVLKLPAQRRW